MKTDDLAAEASLLISAGNLPEAIDMLRKGIDDALRSGDSSVAAHASNLLASTLAATGRDDEALEQYLAAEALRPDDDSLKLQTATFLLEFMRQPQAALEKLSALKAPILPSSNHALSALLGLAHLELGQIPPAYDMLRRMVASVEMLHPLALDLRFVEELAERGLFGDMCRQYLELVVSRAKQFSELSVQRAAETLLSAL